jgi:hypothetical protein
MKDHNFTTFRSSSSHFTSWKCTFFPDTLQNFSMLYFIFHMVAFKCGQSSIKKLHISSLSLMSEPVVTLISLFFLYEGVSESFRAGRLERELQMVQLSATRCSCIAILWASLVSFAAITFCVASQRVFVVVYFVIDLVRKLLDTPSYFIPLGQSTFLLALFSAALSFVLEPWWLSRCSDYGWTIGVLGFDSRRGLEFFSSPQSPERLWGPPSLLSTGYRGLFPCGKEAWTWSWPLTFI